MNDGWPFGRTVIERCNLCCARFGVIRTADLGAIGRTVIESAYLYDPRKIDELVRYHLEHRERGQA